MTENNRITAKELRFIHFMKDERIANEYRRIQRNIQNRADKGYNFTMLISEVNSLERRKVISLLKDDGFIVETHREWFDCPIEYFISWEEPKDDFLEWQVETIVKNFDILEKVLKRLDNTQGQLFIDLINRPKESSDEEDDEDDEDEE